MEITQTVSKAIKVITDIICNKCGKSCKPDECDDYYGLIEVSFDTGYYSSALPDGETYTFSLCEECIAELMKGFKHPAKTDSYI